MPTITHFLDYAASYPNAKITHSASGMVLHLDFHASYLSKTR